MEDAWQPHDMAPPADVGVGIPSQDVPTSGAPANGSEDPYSNGGGHSPVPPPRRSSRSRSPGRGGRSEGGGGTNPGNNLHVSSLSHRVDNRELETIFGKIGRVQKASVMYDPHTRESRGFGFVTMESPEEADAAITALNGTEISGKVIHVEKARRGRARTPTPGRYYGPPKRSDRGYERPYDPRPYDSRYSRDRRDRYDDYPPRRDRYDDRGIGKDRDDRGYRDDRGFGGRDRDYDRGGRDFDRPPRF